MARLDAKRWKQCLAQQRKATRTEATPAGEQFVIPGVKPITEQDRLKQQATAPLAPAVAQKPCNHGLFDEAARDQLDLVELAKKGAKQ